MEKAKIPTYKMVRELPSGVKVVKTINGIPLYNMNIFQNIMSWNQHNLDIPATEYFGNSVTYRELPSIVENYAKGFDRLGIDKDSIITMSLPVSNEYIFSLFAIAKIGAISNNVNFLFLRNDLKTYTALKNSDTLITLDFYLPFIVDQIKDSGIKNIILTSLNDYLPEERKDYFCDLGKLPKAIRDKIKNPDVLSQCISSIRNLRGINFIRMSDIISEGQKSKNQWIDAKVDIEKDSIYSYTSGTTGPPKCIVFKEQAPNAIIEMHNGLDLKESVGDRSLLVIPSSHSTGMFYATYLQMAKGKTLVLQPIYDKNTFAQDLEKFHINHTLAAGSFYISNVEKSVDLSNLTRPCSGGEPITKSNVHQINSWLNRCGCNEKIAIGGGSGEVGSSALTSYELEAKNKTNETGTPIPGVYVKIVDPNTGQEVKSGQRGIIHISSAASSDRYLNDKQATDRYYYTDSNGINWVNLDDITVQNSDGSFSMLGRASDSYIDDNGNTVYLFDIEYSLDKEDPVLEWEITAFSIGGGSYAKVAQAVLKNDYSGNKSDIVNLLCSKYLIDAVKFYDYFETSEVTGKRDYQILKNDRMGYYAPCDENRLYRIDFSIDSAPAKQVIEKSNIDSCGHTLKKVKNN